MEKALKAQGRRNVFHLRNPAPPVPVLIFLVGVFYKGLKPLRAARSYHRACQPQ